MGVAYDFYDQHQLLCTCVLADSSGTTQDEGVRDACLHSNGDRAHFDTTDPVRAHSITSPLSPNG